MRIDIITLFPELCEAVMGESIVGRARKKGAIEVYCHQLREYTYDKHNRVDDTPYGGGMGMLLMAEPIADCFEHVCELAGRRPHLIYMSPQGKTLTQQRARELAEYDSLAILCGRRRKTFSCCAATMRVWMNGFWRSMWMKKSLSETMCLPEESCPPWCWRMQSAAWCPACFPATNALRRKAISAAFWNIPIIPSRRFGAENRCQRCC